MRMSTKGRYAVNALIDLSLREAAGPVALATISTRQQVSLSYLEQMFSRLRRVGVVESTRGPGGGYTLGRKASEITVAEIVTAVDDALEGAEEAAADGLSQALWQRLNESLLQHMATISLQSLVDEQQAQGAVVATRPARPVEPAQAAKSVRSSAPNSVFAFGALFRPLMSARRRCHRPPPFHLHPQPHAVGHEGQAEGGAEIAAQDLAFEVAAADFRGRCVVNPAAIVQRGQRQRPADAAPGEFAAHFGQRRAGVAEPAGDEIGFRVGVAGHQVGLADARVEHGQAGVQRRGGDAQAQLAAPAALSSITLPATGPMRPRMVLVPKCCSSK